jgi:hypothetical protein
MRTLQIRNPIVLAILLLILAWTIRTASNFIIEYSWWKEVGQASTWISMLWYSIAPAAVGALLAFIGLWVAHARGLRFAGSRPRNFRRYSRLVAPECDEVHARIAQRSQHACPFADLVENRR